MTRPCERMPVEPEIGPVGRALSLPFIAVIHLYRWTLSPIVGGHCRHIPTCSCYGLEAYRLHGPVRGTVLTAWRILRCQPLCRGGFDPVPPPRGARAPDSRGKSGSAEVEVSKN